MMAHHRLVVEWVRTPAGGHGWRVVQEYVGRLGQGVSEPVCGRLRRTVDEACQDALRVDRGLAERDPTVARYLDRLMGRRVRAAIQRQEAEALSLAWRAAWARAMGWCRAIAMLADEARARIKTPSPPLPSPGYRQGR